MAQRVIFFDIDHTLLSGSTGHLEAFAVAFREVYGVYASIFMVNNHGKTDQELIAEVLQACGVPAEVSRAKLSECLQVMTDYFAAVKDTIEVHPYPGVGATLGKLRAEGNILGLTTGNLEPIAHGKMLRAGIDSYFAVGGYGSDSADRPGLVACAVRRARDRFGAVADHGYLFGDAPQDMAAAVSNGLHAIGVTTGAYTERELRAAGAADVVRGVADYGDVMRVLMSPRGG